MDAINSVVDLFEGEPKHESATLFSLNFSNTPAISNRFTLQDMMLLLNLQAVQRNNSIPEDGKLEYISGKAPTAEGEIPVNFPNFSVEMETGTGKTYVYIRTALELYVHYGFTKFIVVVPSVAIREGVIKAFKDTRDHLRDLYGNIPYRSYVYDSASLAQVRQFANSPSIEFMIMTIDSFNKALNVIRQSRDQLSGDVPLHLIQATRPILILDEPQNMGSDLSKEALCSLNPLFALRYSATHREPFNLVYRLTPYDAYRHGLVKRIAVAGIESKRDYAAPFVRVISITHVKHTHSARVAIHKMMKDGTIREDVAKVRPGDSLYAKSNRPEYKDFRIVEIGSTYIRFANNMEIYKGEEIGSDKEAIFRQQIAYTIKEHFIKQNRFKQQGIKILSLFFIDRVANYVDNDGIIRKIFDEEFNNIKQEPGFEYWQEKQPEQVRSAYFAEKKRRGGEKETVDSSSGKTKEDEKAYNLIMKEKERLLSFDEPVSFIFSHSALREGWDNPNVFQICTLNQTISEIKKRQEVGRGVRLAVDQNGDRVFGETVNRLTVVANESYEAYVRQLQEETEAEYGKQGLAPNPDNARKTITVKIRPDYLDEKTENGKNFRDLWHKIAQKTLYSVDVDTNKIIREALERINNSEIAPPSIVVRKAEVDVGEKEEYKAVTIGAEVEMGSPERRSGGINLIELMENQLANTSPPIQLSRKSLIEIVKKTARQKEAIENPNEFARIAVRALKECLEEELVKGIKYSKIEEWFKMEEILDKEIIWPEDWVVKTKHSVYDHIVCDSGSKVEKGFAENIDNLLNIISYLKLPRKFRIQTPIGEYNPDWGIALVKIDEHGENVGILYLVHETKYSEYPGGLRKTEKLKVDCGRAHFEHALGLMFKVGPELKL